MTYAESSGRSRITQAEPAERAALPSILERARRLEPEAFDQIVDGYGGRLFGFFRRFLGDQELAEDLTQEVFLRVVRMIPQYEDRGRFEAWLFRIAANVARDRLRELQRSPRCHALDTESEGSRRDGSFTVVEPMTDDSPPRPGLEAMESMDRLQSAISRLQPAEREVVLLRHFSQLSFAEIADMTSVPLGTVLARSHRGLKKLRQWMEASW